MDYYSETTMDTKQSSVPSEPNKRIGQYIIHQTIGDGSSCKVKLATNTKNGQRVAVKILNKDLSDDNLEIIMQEVAAIRQIKPHDSIQTYLGSGHELYQKKDKSKSRMVYYFVLELAENGILFDYLVQSGAFSEKLARFYFIQIIEGLHYLHQVGICHRDLKPENLFLDGNFNMKIGDFGFAAPMKGRDGTGTHLTYLGTDGFMAPEIHLTQPYEGNKIDVFATGVILFNMVMAAPPFGSATPNDPYYKLIVSGKIDKFWSVHEHHTKIVLSDDLKALIIDMLKLIPAERATLEQICEYAWVT